MKRISILIVMAIALTGCASLGSNMRELPPPSLEASVQPGQVSAHLELNLQQVVARITRSTYIMKRVDQGEGYVQIWGKSFQINSTDWGKDMKLVPGGWVIGAQYRYNGSDWRTINRGDWHFGIENARDNGQHPLEIRVTYEIWLRGEKTVGTAPLEPYWVSNMGD